MRASTWRFCRFLSDSINLIKFKEETAFLPAHSLCFPMLLMYSLGVIPVAFLK